MKKRAIILSFLLVFLIVINNVWSACEGYDESDPTELKMSDSQCAKELIGKGDGAAVDYAMKDTNLRKEHSKELQSYIKQNHREDLLNSPEATKDICGSNLAGCRGINWRNMPVDGLKGIRPRDVDPGTFWESFIPILMSGKAKQLLDFLKHGVSLAASGDQNSKDIDWGQMDPQDLQSALKEEGYNIDLLDYPTGTEIKIEDGNLVIADGSAVGTSIDLDSLKTGSHTIEVSADGVTIDGKTYKGGKLVEADASDPAGTYEVDTTDTFTYPILSDTAVSGNSIKGMTVYPNGTIFITNTSELNIKNSTNEVIIKNGANIIINPDGTYSADYGLVC